MSKRASRIPTDAAPRDTAQPGSLVQTADERIERIKAALQPLRIPAVPSEFDLHASIAEALDVANIAYIREARIAPRCRVDFLVEGDIALEVKKSKPPTKALLRQIERYLSCPGVAGLLLVVERSAYVPPTVCGKPCALLGLNRLWGVALP